VYFYPTLLDVQRVERIPLHDSFVLNRFRLRFQMRDDPVHVVTMILEETTDGIHTPIPVHKMFMEAGDGRLWFLLLPHLLTDEAVYGKN
jgi:hypothetical protein